jgi:hypothetical protein
VRVSKAILYRTSLKYKRALPILPGCTAADEKGARGKGERKGDGGLFLSLSLSL